MISMFFASSRSSFVRSVVSLGSGLAAIASVGASYASSSFPSEIASKLSAQAPACTVCHSSNAGGNGTVVTVFGKYMQSRGLNGSDIASLDKALAAAEGEGQDSNKDGVTDIAALKKGEDPNAPASGGDGGTAEAAPEPVEGGCAISPISHAGAVETAGFGLLCVAAAQLAQRRRDRRQAR